MATESGPFVKNPPGSRLVSARIGGMWWRKPEDSIIKRKPLRSGMTVLVIPDASTGGSRRFSLRWGWMVALGVTGLCIGLGAFGAPLLLAGSLRANVTMLSEKLTLEGEKRDLERRLNIEAAKVESLTSQTRDMGARLQTLESRVQDVSERAGVTRVTRASLKPRGGNANLVETDPFKILAALNAQFAEVNTSFDRALPSLDGQLRREAAIPSGFPTSGRITSKFGTRFGPSGRWERHTGWDIATALGSPVTVTAPGVVETAGWTSIGFGFHIIVNHGNGLKTLYGHLSKILVRAGQVVSAGDLIGLVGSTGYSSGPHLHYELRLNGQPISPGPYLFRERPKTANLGDLLPTTK